MKRVIVNPYARKKVDTTSTTSETSTSTSKTQKSFDLFESLQSNHHEQYSILNGTDDVVTQIHPPTTTTRIQPQQPPSLSNNLTVWQRPSVSTSLSFGSAAILTMPQACQVREAHMSIRVTGIVLHRWVASSVGEEDCSSGTKVHLVLGDPIAPFRTSSILKGRSTLVAAHAPSATHANSNKKTSSVLFDKSAKTKKIVFRKKTERRLSFAATGSLAKVDPAVQFKEVLETTPNRLWVIAPAGTILNLQDNVTVIGETEVREGKTCLIARIVRKTNGMHMKLYHDALLARQARLAQTTQQNNPPSTST